MPEDDYETGYLSTLPTEVLLHIFTFLPGRQLIRSRQVCLRWLDIIDELTGNDPIWRNHCKADFSDVYASARQKAKIGLNWYHIYRSLALWPSLKSARDTKDEFASASCLNEQIWSFTVLRNGEIGVLTKGAITYYDIQTLEPSKRSKITGNYTQYTENDDTMVISTHWYHLFIVRKVIHGTDHAVNATFDSVKNFILVDRKVYYISLDNEIYVCDLDSSNLKSVLLTQCQAAIMCLGYNNDRLNLLTFNRDIYCLSGCTLELVSHLDDHPNIINQLNLYSLLETVEWRVISQWMCLLNRRISMGLLQEILTVRKYGDVLFVGCTLGILQIYYAPYTSEELDISNAEPIKQYNFMERPDCPVLTDCPIIKIDVVESKEGHTVLVAMPKKIAIIDFVHNFKRTASLAMLPYSDIQRVKQLKMEECK